MHFDVTNNRFIVQYSWATSKFKFTNRHQNYFSLFQISSQLLTQIQFSCFSTIFGKPNNTLAAFILWNHHKLMINCLLIWSIWFQTRWMSHKLHSQIHHTSSTYRFALAKLTNSNCLRHQQNISEGLIHWIKIRSIISLTLSYFKFKQKIHMFQSVAKWEWSVLLTHTYIDYDT